MHRTDAPTAIDLETRVTELERSLGEARRAAVTARRTTVVLGGALLLAATIAAVGPQRVLDVVQATRLEILDQEGRVVASLTSGERGGQLDLWDDAGRNILRASANRHGADLALWSADGSDVAALYATADGGRLTMHGTDGTTVARLDANRDGGHLRLADDTGAIAATIGIDREGGMVGLGASGGDATVALRGNATGGSLTLGDESGGSIMAVADAQHAVFRIAADDASAGLSASSGAAMMNADLTGGNGVRVRATPTTGPVVQLGHGSGPIVELSGVDGTGRLDLTGHDGRRTSIASSRGLMMTGSGGGAVASLLNDEGRGRLVLHDAEGRPAAGIDAGSSSRPGAIHLDHAGERLFAIASTPTGGLLNIMNRHGRSVIALGVTNGGVDGGGISILNGEGMPVVTTGIASDRGGHLSVFSADGALMRMVSPPASDQ